MILRNHIIKLCRIKDHWSCISTKYLRRAWIEHLSIKKVDVIRKTRLKKPRRLEKAPFLDKTSKLRLKIRFVPHKIAHTVLDGNGLPQDPHPREKYICTRQQYLDVRNALQTTYNHKISK